MIQAASIFRQLAKNCPLLKFLKSMSVAKFHLFEINYFLQIESETFRKGNDRCAKLRNIMIDIDDALDNDNGKIFFLKNSRMKRYCSG